MQPSLSKSRYLTGLQCPKHLWLKVHDPSKIPEVDEVTQHRFDQGHLVGELAKEVFPDGVDIKSLDVKESFLQTKKLLSERKPLFEAAVPNGVAHSRIDVLNPIKEKEWDLIEVKSSTSVKDPNIDDVAFQAYCCVGLNINKCYVMHLNNKFVKDGPIDPKKLFVQTDITPQVGLVSTDIHKRVEKMLEIINMEKCPDCTIGPHCVKPYKCPLIDECWSSLPEDNVFDLYSGGKKCFELYDKGFIALKDIPVDYKLTYNQLIQRECAVTGKTHVDRKKIKEFLEKLEYPLYYLDFETYSIAIPIYDGLKPYQQIPFQFSLHVQDSNGSVKHFSFLADGNKDPRKDFLDAANP